MRVFTRSVTGALSLSALFLLSLSSCSSGGGNDEPVVAGDPPADPPSDPPGDSPSDPPSDPPADPPPTGSIRYDINGDYRWESLALRTEQQKIDGVGGGEGMQFPFDVDIAPSNDQIAYLLTDTSQVWRSDDAGISWRRAAGGFVANGGLSLAIDPQDPLRVLVAASVHLNGRSEPSADGIWITEDGGASWSRSQAATYLREQRGGDAIAFDPLTNQVLAGTHAEGLFWSNDRGVTWQSLNLLVGDPITDVVAHQSFSGVFYLAANSGLYRYDRANGLQTLDTLPARPINVETDATNGRRLWVTVENNGVYWSEDGGLTLTARSTGMGYRQVNWLSSSPADPNRLIASMYNTGGNTLWISDNGGASWQRNQSLFSMPEVNQNSGGFFFGTPIGMSPTDPNVAIAVAAANVIVRSLDGGLNWVFASTGFTGARVLQHGRGFDAEDDDILYLFLVDFGALVSRDGAQSFRTSGVPRYNDRQTTYSGAVKPGSNGQTVVTAAGDYNEQALIISNDGGESWRDSGRRGRIEFVGFSPTDSERVYAGRYRSDDGGVTWSTLTRSVDHVGAFSGSVYSYDGRQLRWSDDGGDSWSVMGQSMSCNIEVVAELDEQEGALIAAGACGVYKLINNVWQQRDTADGIQQDFFGSQDTRAIAVSPVDSNFVCIGKWITYRGHSNGVFCSADAGEQWRAFSFDLQMPFTPWSLAFAPSGELHMGSSHGNFVLRSD
ncbi:MAG: hypothetical protein AAGA84_00385 [Pseudomonadota bacterium]